MRPETLRGRLVLSGVGPAVLDRLLARAGAATRSARSAPEGAQVKVNMLLRRLPRLRDDRVAPEAAFAGTFHINETMSQLDGAYAVAAGGGIPNPLPAEIYCHSLTDPSILGAELRAEGAQTLTLFGLQVPHRLVAEQDRDAARTALLEAAERSLDSVLAEPIADCVYEAPDGSPCVEARTTADLRGVARHDRAATSSTARCRGRGPRTTSRSTLRRRAGASRPTHARVLLCGSGARRGGAVSGLGGHNAAMAALELLRR